MYEKMFEQAQNAIKPMGELMAINAKIIEQSTEKQASFVKDWLSDSMAFAKELSSQKDYSGIYQTQKTYLEACQEKLIAASTEAYEVLSENQEKLSEVFKKNSAM